MLDKIHDIIKSDFTDLRNEEFLLAVSGGRDSMVMATCFKKLGLNFEILHCHFGLRPEAFKETQLVLNWCLDNQKKAFVCYFPTPHLESIGKSTQEVCRDLRYKWFKQMKVRRRDAILVTAHHAGDDRETFLINLVRGSGIVGLSGIRSSALEVYRPMLSLSQEEISDFSKIHQVPYLHDPSNFSNKYFRNKIRRSIVPKLKELDRNALKGLDRSIEHLKEASQFVQKAIDEICSKYVTSRHEGMVISEIKRWPPFLLKTYLSQLGFSYDLIIEIFKKSENVGRLFESKKWHLLTISEGLYLTKKDLTVIDLEINQMGTFDLDDQRQVIIEKTGLPDDLKTIDVGSQVIVDAQLIKFPMRFRYWQVGDRMTPLGMSGRSKKVSDILTDAKVNKLDKMKALVAEDASGELFWLIGHRISHAVRVTDDSTSYLSISIIPSPI